MPRISVIMPVFNERISYLKDSINSILRQTYTNFEFIIIDDNPNSYKIRQYLIKRSLNNKKIKVIFNDENIGTVKSANKAISYASGKYIARMDGDDIAYRNRLKIQLDCCERYNLKLLCTNFSSIVSNKIKTYEVYSGTTLFNQNKLKRVLSHINIAMGSSLFYERDIVSKVGKYRNILCEDYDLVVRFLINGYKIGYLSKPLMYKRFREHSLSGKNSLKEYIIIKLIGKYLRFYNYKKILPVSFICRVINNIKDSDVIRYKKFILSSQRYKRHRSILNGIKRYFWACSSPLIFRRNIFILFYKIIENYFM